MATVRYIVDDVVLAIPFYESLGFQLLQNMGPIAMLGLDDLVLWVAGPGTSARRPMPDGRAPEPGGWNRLVITVPDIDAAVARLRTTGAKFRNDIVSGPGGKQILIEDPSGNCIELFQPAG